MSAKKKNSYQSEKPQNAYFLSLELENVQCFGEKQKIDFSDGIGNPKQWTIILGDNGTGKTTLLKGIVAMFPIDHQLFDEENEVDEIVSSPLCYEDRSYFNLFRESYKKTFIETELILQNNLQNSLNKKEVFSLGAKNHFRFEKESEDDITIYQSPNNSWCSFRLGHRVAQRNFAYGASRKAGNTSISKQNKESSFSTLLDETILLTNPEEWLIRSNYESLLESEAQKKRKQKLNKIIETLIQILPDITEIRFGEKTINNKFQPIVEFLTPYGWVEAKDLSLGYRTSMAWMVDFASRMFDLYPDSENPLAEPAVVLIDEIDLHLHPKWQRDLLDWLSNLFPNTQFIVTTHSPLIVQSAATRDANFAVCRREGDHVVIDQTLDAVKNWRADQILTSDLFGLETARPKEIEEDLLERQQILSKAKLTKKDEKRLKEIETKVGDVPMMENPLYDKMMDVIFRASEKIELGVLQETGIKNIPDFEEIIPGERITVAGIVSSLQVKQSKKGNQFCIFKLEDKSKSVKCLCWSEAYTKFQHYLSEDAPLVVTGKVESADGQEITIIIEEVNLLETIVPMKTKKNTSKSLSGKSRRKN